MFKYTLIFSLIIHSYIVNSVDMCGSGSACVCRDNNKDSQDYLGEHVDCTYCEGQNLLTADYGLPDLVYSLDLSSSNITELQPSKLLQSSTMIKLFINNNHIREITVKVFDLPELKWLELSNNELEYINRDVLLDINKLEYLNLANNRFVTFEKLRFHHLRNLDELVIDNNDLGASIKVGNLFDRKTFGLTHKIKKLSISGIDLCVVPDNFFSSAYDLRKLVISNNKLKDIFELPFTLEYLDLSDNPIEEISIEDFNDLIALKVLKLNNLAIKEVPEYVFDSLHSLTVLELERNKNLTEFNSLAFGHEVLEDADDFLLEMLSLKGSRLTKLNEDLAEPFGQLTSLDLQGNPFECNCDIEWLKSLQIEPGDYEYLRCGSPKTLFNAKIFDLDPKYLSCEETSNHVGLAIAAVVFCILMAGIAFWFFVFIPRYQSRGNCISDVEYPTAAYTVLPLHRTDS